MISDSTQVLTPRLARLQNDVLETIGRTYTQGPMHVK